MTERLSALSLFAAMLLALSPTAEARIEISPPADPAPLRLSGAQVREAPNVIVIQEDLTITTPQPFPGGCFNCGTLRSNRDNNAYLLGRSHRFSRNLHDSNGQRIILLPP